MPGPDPRLRGLNQPIGHVGGVVEAADNHREVVLFAVTGVEVPTVVVASPDQPFHSSRSA